MQAHSASANKHVYEFGEFRLDPAERILLRDDKVIALTPKVFDLLLVLVENSGRTVEKEELMKRVWPDSFVEEANLSVNMTALRRALGEGPDDHRYIQTVPRRGYRFVASVIERWDNGSTASQPDDGEKAQGASKQTHASLAARRGFRASHALIISALLLVALGVAPFYSWMAKKPGEPPSAAQIKSIAVLPLDNLSGDPAQDYFAEAMHDSLITELGRIGALRVISRRSVMQYKRARKPLREIAEKLGVDWVLEGSVQLAGGRAKITARLIRATTEKTQWTYSYERTVSNILSLQGEVARDIAKEIDVKLTPQDAVRLANTHSINPDALYEFQWGLHFQEQFVNEQREEPDREALRRFERAISIDPDFALAYAHVTFCYGTLANRFGFHELIPQAKQAALKAVELDSTLPEAHGALAFVLNDFDWDWSGAEREFKLAIDLNPSYSWAHWGYANLLTAAGRYEEAIAENRIAEKLAPVVSAPNVNIGYNYSCMREYDRAIEQYRKALDVSPDSSWVHGLIGFAYQCKGMYDQALAEYQKARDLSGDELEYRQLLLSLYAMSGKRSEALRMLAEFKEPTKKRHLTSRQVAEIYSLLGDKQQAFAWLEKAYAEHDWSLLFIRCNPEFDGMSSDPRYQELLRRIAFPR